MRTTELLLRELDLEAHFTRRHLERVPMDQLDFKPHEKSMSLGWLATFIAILPSWGALTLGPAEFDVTGPMPPEHSRIATSMEDLLALFDRNIAATREALTRMTDDRLDEPWSLKAGNHAMTFSPRRVRMRGPWDSAI